MRKGLTIVEIKAGGNVIIAQDIEDMTLVTRYGKHTYNNWQSFDGGSTFVNTRCYSSF